MPQDLTPEDPTFVALSQRLRLRELSIAEPSADLWARIVARQEQRLRGARIRRVGLSVGAATLAAAAALAAGVAWRHAATPATIDWQARAQALELELRAADGARHRLSPDALSELARVDAALQAAYDDGGAAARVTPLWRRRSELLSALLQARESNVEISRI